MSNLNNFFYNSLQSYTKITVSKQDLLDSMKFFVGWYLLGLLDLKF